MITNYTLDNLNEAQRDAVCSLSLNSLVIAGAGSGKTRVLIQRILWLIEDNNFSHFSILVVRSIYKKLASWGLENLGYLEKSPPHV